MSEHAGDALGVLLIDTATGARRVRVVDYLDGASEESATVAAHAWIKALRHAAVDGQPLRRRFRFREDSLWWFAELYLHKQQVILNIHRIIAALDSARENGASAAGASASAASSVASTTN